VQTSDIFPCYIFKSDPNGTVLWLGTEKDLQTAKARVQTIATSQPGEYLIVDQHAGAKIPPKVTP